MKYKYGDNTLDESKPLSIYVSMQQYDEQHQHDHKARSIIYSDATGRYPLRSFAGNQYIMTSVYKGFVYMVPIKTRTKDEMVKAYKATHDYFEYFTLQHMDTNQNFNTWTTKHPMISKNISRKLKCHSNTVIRMHRTTQNLKQDLEQEVISI
jgi:hypothetical protein